MRRQGDTIPLGADRALRVLGVRDNDADQPPALIVEDLPGSARSARMGSVGMSAFRLNGVAWREKRAVVGEAPSPHKVEPVEARSLAKVERG